MHVALWLVSLLTVVIAVSGACRRWDLPAPVVLVVVGIVGSFLPFVPEVELTAEVVLVGLLPPLLYSASLQTSLLDFNANRRAILLLSIGLVAFTTLGVGLVVHAVVPGLSWPAAFALGAVVAPPDAVAASAVARRIGLPRRIVTILEGESLLNDATALVALGTAVLAATGEATLTGVGLDFLVAAGGGVLVGVVVFAVVGWVRRHVSDPAIDTSVSLVTPFIAYVAAEQIHASGILAIVFAGLLLGHQAPVLQTASSRIAERLNWRTISFLLENSVFLLIGLQARRILDDVGAGDAAQQAVPTTTVVLACAAVLLAVVVLRLVWVFPARYLLLRPGAYEGGEPYPWTYTLVVGWAGMRGVVTLAAAFAIPASFEHRDVLVLVALVVTAGTLLLQGLSLPWLVRRLRVPAPDPREDALAAAGLLHQAGAAGLAWLDARSPEDDPHGTRMLLRERLERRDLAAWERLGTGPMAEETPSEEYGRLRLGMLQAERARVLEIRSEGNLPHEVVEGVLDALDVEESMIGRRAERRERLVGAIRRPSRPSGSAGPEECRHLQEARSVMAPAVAPECQDCVAEGTRWVHLRVCLACGHVGCCDSSPRRHASAHHSATGHPVIQSAEPGETWRWCFVDDLLAS